MGIPNHDAMFFAPLDRQHDDEARSEWADAEADRRIMADTDRLIEMLAEAIADHSEDDVEIADVLAGAGITIQQLLELRPVDRAAWPVQWARHHDRLFPASSVADFAAAVARATEELARDLFYAPPSQED